MIGAVAEYHRRMVAERVRSHQIESVKRGVAPQPHTPSGLRRREDGRFEPDPATGPVMRKVFERVASGTPITQACRYAGEHGLPFSYHGLWQALRNEAYRGVVRFGKLRNEQAHEPLVDAETFRRCRKLHGRAGRKAKSQELLARLGVLRCSTCGSAMAVNTTRERYRTYRCSAPNGYCSKRVSIMIHLADRAVVEAVKAALSDVSGRASIEDQAQAAERALGVSQERLDRLIELLDPLEPAAQKRLQQATAERDQAELLVEQLGGRAIRTVRADVDWDALTLDERRALIRAVVKAATVQPGRGTGRVTVELQ
jgi:site-specific DNA recombinase